MIIKPPCVSFTCKKLFTSPCKGIIRFFKFKKPVFIRRTLRPRKTTSTKRNNNTNVGCLTSFFKSLRRKEKDMDRVMELKSFSDAGGYTQNAPCPSPLTPAYIKMAGRGGGMESMVEEEDDDDDDVENGCRRFESYLVKMIGEEGKMRDLVDVEELLYCWKKLKSPVFMNLVCRFYGELCKDLFSENVDDDNHHDDIRKPCIDLN